MSKQIINHWKNLSVRYKAPVLCGVLLLPMLLLMLVMTAEFHSYRTQTDALLLSYARSSDFAKDFDSEILGLNEFVYPAPASKTFTDFQNTHFKMLSSWTQLTEATQYDNTAIMVQQQSLSRAIARYCSDIDRFLQLLQDDSFDDKLFLDLCKQSNYISVYTDELIEILLLQGQEAYSNLIHRTSTYNIILISSIVISMLMVALGMAILLNDISQPIHRLSESARLMEQNIFDSPITDRERGDELGHLARTFSAMQIRVQDTIHTLEAQARFEKELRLHEEEEARLTQEAERSRFAQLQSQINPHFLFNTLQSISTMAEFEHAAVACDMTLRLANFFRYTLENDDIVVTLSRELDLLRDYISLQEMRFAERFVVEMECDPSCGSTAIPKFLLQPLVENSIVHGMQQYTTGGRIRVTTKRHDSNVSIIISDNGCGFSRNSLHSENKGHHSIGIFNIAERIKMVGGSFYLFSLPGHGTAVKINIPLKEEVASC